MGTVYVHYRSRVISEVRMAYLLTCMAVGARIGRDDSHMTRMHLTG